MRNIIALAALIALAACATVPTGTAGPGGARSIPSTPLSLGDWRHLTAPAALQNFEREVAGRYSAGLAATAVSSDLRRNEFNCAPNRDAGGRGDPPDEICRRTVTVEGCTHTWQAHLYSTSDAIDRVRALYDRRCGDDGLLGGPG